MSEPDRIAAIEPIMTHVVDGLALLTTQFQKPAIQAILASWLRQIQLVEDAFWQVILATIALATGAALDQYGSLLCCPRNGMVDADYRLIMQAWVLALRSSGTANELEGVMAEVLAGYGFTFREYFPCTVSIEPDAELPFATFETAPSILSVVLRRAKLAGVRLDLIVPPEGSAFLWATGSTIEADSAHGFGSSTDATAGGALAGVVL